jgi:hypothetical protein
MDMEKLTFSPLPQDNQRYNVVRMRNMAENTPFTKEVGAKTNDRDLKPYDPVESEKDLKKLEKLRSHFLLVSSYQYHYPYCPLEIKEKPASLISRLLNLKAIKRAVAGIVKSIIF